ncbi:MAG: pyrimidine-nucleoside phosphorylase [Bacilli bacterium]|nr:pyrimidine-nucleoside phosphorylase [Bacilli bacterium]
MRMVDIIEKKRDGGTLTKEEIHFFVKGYSDGTIPDYQASALCMAIVFRGMDEIETAELTDAMMHSGDTIDLSSVDGVVIDKHSTGGVGDKTSLALGPLVAACGAKLGKMSGRGLGHTGGTLDKMESIPGMKIFLSEKEFIDQINKIGISIIGQTKEIDPADKKLYALRDVTGTVPAIPLIASSIMSKKLAAGSQAILLDVKFGDGAFMKTLDSARELANEMVKIGKRMGRDTRAVLTDMDQPLGLAVGNSLEVKEAIATLKGEGPEDFNELCLSCGSILLQQAKIVYDLEEGRKMIQKAIDDGSGLRKLAEFVKAQGGDPNYILHPELFPLAKHIVPIYSERSGYIRHIDSLSIGLSSMKLGGGREKISDAIDYDAGILLCKKVGHRVEKGEILCYAHTNKEGVESVFQQIKDSFHIQNEKVEIPPIVHDYLH